MLRRGIETLVGAVPVVALLAVLPAVARCSPLTRRSPEEECSYREHHEAAQASQNTPFRHFGW